MSKISRNTKLGFIPRPISKIIKQFRANNSKTPFDTSYYEQLISKIEKGEEKAQQTSLDDFKQAIDIVVQNLLSFIIKIINQKDDEQKKNFLINIYTNIFILSKPFIKEPKKWSSLKPRPRNNHNEKLIYVVSMPKYKIDNLSIIFCKSWFSRIIKSHNFKHLIGSDAIDRIYLLIQFIIQFEFH